MYDLKGKFLEAVQRLLEGEARSKSHPRYGKMIRSHAPKAKRTRTEHVKRPRKPAPNGREALVARQKKARL